MTEKVTIIESNKRELENTLTENASLNDKLKINEEESKSLTDKVKSLETKLTEVKSSSQILEKIRDMMVHKGFLSDKELDNILKEFD